MSASSKDPNRPLARPETLDITTVQDYFTGVASVLQQLPLGTVEQITNRLTQAYDQNRTVFLFGNGGSAALASHHACDLGKGTTVDGSRRFRVLSLTDNVPLLTAWANDTAYEEVFTEQLRNFVQPGDVSFAISCSGNSPNVLNALSFSRQAGAFNIGLSGFAGGKMEPLCHLCLVVPSDNMQYIEDMHLSVTHAIFTVVRSRIAHSARALAPAAVRS